MCGATLTLQLRLRFDCRLILANSRRQFQGRARYQQASAMIKDSIGTPSDRAAAARSSNISTFKGERSVMLAWILTSWAASEWVTKKTDFTGSRPAYARRR